MPHLYMGLAGQRADAHKGWAIWLSSRPGRGLNCWGCDGGRSGLPQEGRAMGRG
jgi:hypothetical protein